MNTLNKEILNESFPSSPSCSPPTSHLAPQRLLLLLAIEKGLIVLVVVQGGEVYTSTLKRPL
jgi:hypothetical protein